LNILSKLRNQRKQKIKAAIKSTALSLAEESGWQAVTVRKIADQILYAPPIIYEHFKNKNDLLRHLALDGFQELKKSTLQKMAKELYPQDKLLAMADVRFDFAQEHHVLHYLMFDAENPDWQTTAGLQEMNEIKMEVNQQIEKLSQESDPELIEEYFINLMCLIKGYTYFNNQYMQVHLMQDQKQHDAFLHKGTDMKLIYLKAIKRFIDAIKT
jgi:AcrR family transcriptional regulator